MATLTGAHRKRMVPGGLRSSTSVESGLPWNWNRIKPASTPACPTQSKDQETSAHFFPAEPGRNGHQFCEFLIASRVPSSFRQTMVTTIVVLTKTPSEKRTYLA